MTTPEPAPGQTWRSLGKSGHTKHLIKVIKRTAGGRVVVAPAITPRRRSKGRVRTINLAAFLNNYALEGVPHERPTNPPAAPARCPHPPGARRVDDADQQGDRDQGVEGGD